MADQNRAIEFGLLFSLPAAGRCGCSAEPIVRVLFERGSFGPEDTLRTAGALAAFAVGLPAFVLVKAFTPGFFAREDTRTPLIIAVVSIVVNVALNLLFLYGTALAQVGIALATSLSGWLNAVLLAVVLLRRDIGSPINGSRASAAHGRRHGRHGRRALVALILLTPVVAHANLMGALASWHLRAGRRRLRRTRRAVGRRQPVGDALVMRRQPGLNSADPANNRDAGAQRPVQRGHHQHAIVVGRRHRLAVVVAQHGAGLGDHLLALEMARRHEVAALGGDGVRHLDDPLLGWRRLLPVGRQVGRLDHAGLGEEARATSLATATDEARQCWPVSISKAFLGLLGSPKPP